MFLTKTINSNQFNVTFEYVNVVEDDLLEGHFFREQIVVYQS